MTRWWERRWIGAVVAVMVVAKLAEHLVRDEKGRLRVAGPLAGLGEREGDLADLRQRGIGIGAQRHSHSERTCG